MHTDLLTIHTDQKETYILFTLEGEIDASTSKTLDNMVTSALEPGPQNLVFDLSQVVYISSAGIGIFIYFFGELSKTGRKVIITQPTEVVREILTLLRLEEHVPIVNSEQEAKALIG